MDFYPMELDRSDPEAAVQELPMELYLTRNTSFILSSSRSLDFFFLLHRTLDQYILPVDELIFRVCSLWYLLPFAFLLLNGSDYSWIQSCTFSKHQFAVLCFAQRLFLYKV